MLDFAVIATGYLALGPLGNYTGIRAIRVLRPLRTVTKVEEMRVSTPGPMRWARNAGFAQGLGFKSSQGGESGASVVCHYGPAGLSHGGGAAGEH